MANEVSLQHEVHRWGVKIDGKAIDERKATVLTVQRSLGMRHVDIAVIAIERGGEPALLNQNSQIRPIETGKRLHVYDAKTNEIKFFGVVTESDVGFGERPDHKRIVATIQPYHFGPPITNVQFTHIKRVRTGKQALNAQVDGPIVFNGWADRDRQMAAPTSRNAVVGNKTTRENLNIYGRGGQLMPSKAANFVPLDAVQTKRGQDLYADYYEAYSQRSQWTLRDAVAYLCACGNDEKYIDNPNNGELDHLPDLILPRTELPVGLFLPELLDRFLAMYGWMWYVDPSTEKPIIRFQPAGSGVAFDAKHGKPYTAADFNTTNVLQADLQYSIGGTINEVLILGGKLQVEATLELYKQDGDKYVANEAGEYATSTWPIHRPAGEPPGTDLSSVPLLDLDALFPKTYFGDMAKEVNIQHVYQRRRFLPTLTLTGVPGDGTANQQDLSPIGPNNGVDVEFCDRDQSDVAEASKVWKNISKHPLKEYHSIRLADDELAIYFDRGQANSDMGTDNVDHFLMSMGTDARIRITATIESDYRIQVLVKRKNAAQAPSVQPAAHTYVLADEARYPLRRVLRDGKYRSKYAGEPYTAETIPANNVREKMTDAGRQMLVEADRALIGGSITLMHCDYAVPLGGIVKAISGRSLQLLTTHQKDVQRYPQIVAIMWDVQANRTMLQLDSEMTSMIDAMRLDYRMHGRNEVTRE